MATIDELRARPAPYYSCDRARALLELPAETSTVAVGGFRWLVRHDGPMLYSIRPRAKSAGRGHVAFDPWANPAKSEHSSCQTEILGELYAIDPYGPRRLQEALALTVCAWITANGVIDAFYRAIGRSGSCAICGANLTDPLSMARGIGPECVKHIGIGGRAVREVQRRRVADPNWPVLPAMAEQEV